jgi:hypothetical protein
MSRSAGGIGARPASRGERVYQQVRADHGQLGDAARRMLGDASADTAGGDLTHNRANIKAARSSQVGLVPPPKNPRQPRATAPRLPGLRGGRGPGFAARCPMVPRGRRGDSEVRSSVAMEGDDTGDPAQRIGNPD